MGMQVFVKASRRAKAHTRRIKFSSSGRNFGVQPRRIVHKITKRIMDGRASGYRASQLKKTRDKLESIIQQRRW